MSKFIEAYVGRQGRIVEDDVWIKVGEGLWLTCGGFDAPELVESEEDDWHPESWEPLF